MNDATYTRLRPLADTSPSAIVAGFIAGAAVVMVFNAWNRMRGKAAVGAH